MKKVCGEGFPRLGEEGSVGGVVVLDGVVEGAVAGNGHRKEIKHLSLRHGLANSLEFGKRVSKQGAMRVKQNEVSQFCF